MSGDRRTLITDAAIVTLADAGARGLTHRAVDAAAGLPPGSTSYYFRTRASLLLATADRLAALDVDELGDPLTSAAIDLEDAVLALVEGALGDGRQRQLARYEMALEAARRPELAAALRRGTASVAGAVEQVLARRGVEQPGHRAQELLVLLDGFLLGELTGTAPLTHGVAARRQLVRRLLAPFPLEG